MTEHADLQQLNITIGRLSGTVEGLADRVEKLEVMLERILSIFSGGKWFLAGAVTVVLAAIFGIVGAAKQIKDLFT